MKLKKFFLTPCPYIFLLSYYGVWLIWSAIKLPFSNPVGAISYLPSISYNPSNNLARFGLAVVVPPLMCLGYWWLEKYGPSFWKKHGNRRLGRAFALGLVLLTIVLALSAGLVQGSVKRSNNPADAYGGPYNYPLVDTFHEGETLGPAVSYTQPKLKPYRDFVLVHGVFQDPLRSTIAFKLFGRNIGATRAFEVLLTMLAFVLWYALMLVLFRGDLIKSTVGLLLFAVLTQPDPLLSPIKNWLVGVNIPFRDIPTILFLMCAVWGFRAYFSKRTRLVSAMSAAIGFNAIAGFANSLDRALYIGFLALVWLAMLAFLEKPRLFLRQILLWFGVGGLGGTLVLGLALKWEFVSFLKYTFTMSLYKEFLDGIVFVRPSVGISLILLVVSASLGAVLFWLVRILDQPAVRRKQFKAKVQALASPTRKAIIEHHVLILLSLTALCFLRSALGRSLLDHFVYSVQWLYLALLYFVFEYVFRSYPKKRLLTGYLTILTLGIVLAFFAGAIKKTDLRAEAFPVHMSDQKIVRKDYLQTANYIKTNLHGDETFATLTSEGIWYYLVNKPSPTNYPIIWYAFTKDQRTQLARDVEHDKHIKYLITNNNWTSNIDYVPNETRFPELYLVLHKDYRPVQGFGQQTVWQRLP